MRSYGTPHQGGKSHAARTRASRTFSRAESDRRFTALNANINNNAAKTLHPYQKDGKRHYPSE